MVRKNATFLKWLQEMRDEEEPESNKYMVMNKAFNSLKRETTEYPDPDSLIAVKFIGPKIVSELKKRWKSAGRETTMGEISSNSSSPGKRKRSSGSRATRRERIQHELDSEDEAVLPAPKHRTALIPAGQAQYCQMDVPLGYSAAQFYPPGAYPQMHQPHSTYPQAVVQPVYPDPFVPYPYSQYAPQQSLGSLSSNIPQPPAPSVPSPLEQFKFYYVDSDRKRVLCHEKAVVDIEAGALWYKICFQDCPKSNTHPLRRSIRLDPFENRGRVRGADLVSAWISDRDVDLFRLHTAPGLAGDLQVGGEPVTSASSSQSAVASQVRDREMKSAGGGAGDMSQESRDDSLEDLLRAESKKKGKTIDPTRVMDIEREWDVGTGSKVRKQEDISSPESVRKRVEAAAVARLLSSSNTARPSFSSSTQSQAPSTFTANSTLQRSNTLPGYPHDLGVNRKMSHVLPRDFGLPAQYDPPVPNVTMALRPATAEAPETIRRTVSAPVIPPVAAPTSSKGKQKGRTRGRVSDFAPALPAVDEFDVDLDRQATSQRMHDVATSTSQSAPAPFASESAHLIDDVTDLIAASAPSFPVFDPIVFPPGSFEISMVLDNREVKAHNDRDYIAEELLKKGVNLVRRSLVLGDVLWIAHKFPIARSSAEENECVLDYILERKRLDDLCLSIKDGRFREQKFRLANSALKVFYLIEEFDLEKNREAFGVQIDTARSSTQVVDGFIVKETKKLSYTIDYLVTMHRTIVEEFQNRSLYVIPPYLIKRYSYMAMQKHLRNSQPTMRYLTSYACFEKLNHKTTNLTAKDLFSQMLLSVNGLSAEKVSAIIAKYPTFRSLWEAFRLAEVEEREVRRRLAEEAALVAEQGKKGRRKKKQKVAEAKTMLCDLEASGRQRIGPVRSENIYRLMRADLYQE